MIEYVLVISVGLVPAGQPRSLVGISSTAVGGFTSEALCKAALPKLSAAAAEISTPVYGRGVPLPKGSAEAWTTATCVRVEK